MTYDRTSFRDRKQFCECWNRVITLVLFGTVTYPSIFNFCHFMAIFFISMYCALKPTFLTNTHVMYACMKHTYACNVCEHVMYVCTQRAYACNICMHLHT